MAEGAARPAAVHSGACNICHIEGDDEAHSAGIATGIAGASPRDGERTAAARDEERPEPAADEERPGLLAAVYYASLLGQEEAPE